MIRVAVAGLGYWGPNLARNLNKHPASRVVRLCDLRRERLTAMATLYPGAKLSTDFDEVLRDPAVDAVAIITPVATHYELARRALLAGKHLLVAKPLAETVAQGADLVRLAERQRRVLMVDHTFVYSGPVRTIRELIVSGELGTVYAYDSTRVNLGIFQSDVNVVYDLATHDFSILHHLFEEMPVQLAAAAARAPGAAKYPHESIAYITARYATGMIAHIHVSWCSPVKIRRTLISGERKMIIYDHLDPDNQVKVYDRSVNFASEHSEHVARVQYRLGGMYAPKVDQTEALEIECAHFLSCIENDSRPLTDGYSALRVLAMLDAAQRSMLNGGSPVTVG